VTEGKVRRWTGVLLIFYGRKRLIECRRLGAGRARGMADLGMVDVGMEVLET